MKDSTFFKNKIRLFQNVMVGKNCFYVVAIQPARKGQRRERRSGRGGGGGGGRGRYPKDVRHHSESLLEEENFRYLKATTKLRASSLPSV